MTQSRDDQEQDVNSALGAEYVPPSQMTGDGEQPGGSGVYVDLQAMATMPDHLQGKNWAYILAVSIYSLICMAGGVGRTYQPIY